MHIPEQDKKIIEGCINGRTDSWEKFVRKFSGLIIWSIKSRLEKYGYSFTNGDVEDIHQEVFLYLYNHNRLAQLKDASKIAAWLCVISGHIAENYIGRRGRVIEKSVSLFEEITSSEEYTLTIADILESKELPIPEQIDEKIKQEILEGIIQSLSWKEKLIFNLYFVYENTIVEIAENLNLAQGTVASIITRAKDKLKKKIGDRFL